LGCRPDERHRAAAREFALRIALGARGGHVFGQVIAEGARLVIAGIVAGMLASVLVAQSISRITPANEPLSPWIWIAAPLTLALAVTAASVLPARKALASDPLLIMKDDM
jgi:ABC-type antimicrobial peptide transport system permease subunit